MTDQPGLVVADHLWLDETQALAALDLQPGEVVEFQASVTAYIKGYFGRREDVHRPMERDYTLSYPTQVRKVLPQEAQIV